MRFLSTFLFLLFTNTAFSQEVLWAHRVGKTNDTSSFSNVKKGLLGVPNCIDQVGINSHCWPMGLTKGGEEISGDIFVQVRFSKSINARQVVVVENYNPGSIKSISVFDINGNEKVIYTALPKALGQPTRWLSVTFDPLPNLVSSVMIVAEPTRVLGANCIDAVGLSESTSPIKPVINNCKEQLTPALEVLGPNINTGHNEYFPCISPDGKLLVFSRDNDPKNIDGYNGDIWFSINDSIKGWSKAKNAGRPINNGDYNFASTILPNGSLFLGNAYNEDASKNLEGTSIAKKNKFGWDMPYALKVEDYSNRGSHASYFLSQNKKIMLMNIQDQDHLFGGLDLYVSMVSDGVYSPPISLGPNINTVNEEISVWLSGDEKTLYFISNGWNGYGGFDIFRSSRLDDTWRHWSLPENLGPVVNTKDDELHITMNADETMAYGYKYVKSTDSYDIYSMQFPPKEKPVVAEAVVKEDDELILSGTVYDKATNTAILADLSLVNSIPNSQGYKLRSFAQKGFKLRVKKGQTYNVNIQAKGYFTYNGPVSVDSSKIVVQDFHLEPIEIGHIVRLDHIIFQQSSSEVDSNSMEELNEVVKFLNENPTVNIRLDGHTDVEGNAEKNLRLSEERVMAVRKYLISKNIDKERMTIKAYGGSKPLTRETSEEARKLNRRVEFVVMKK
ncbi:MAG TPA: OmpA family protein [Cytophagaceae bacterium]